MLDEVTLIDYLLNWWSCMYILPFWKQVFCEIERIANVTFPFQLELALLDLWMDGSCLKNDRELISVLLAVARAIRAFTLGFLKQSFQLVIGNISVGLFYFWKDIQKHFGPFNRKRLPGFLPHMHATGPVSTGPTWHF